jgi:hypothetical protein
MAAAARCRFRQSTTKGVGMGFGPKGFGSKDARANQARPESLLQGCDKSHSGPGRGSLV